MSSAAEAAHAGRVRSTSGVAAYRWATGLLAAVVFLACMSWALVSAPFSGPDERAHYNSVTRIMSGGGWPLPYEAQMESWTVTAVTEAGWGYRGQRDESPPLPTARSTIFAGGNWENLGKDQMVQHPPLYYGVVAAAASMIGDHETQWDAAQLMMRISSAAMLAGAIPFLVSVGRHVSGSPRAGVIGGTSVLLMPFFTNIGGFINNDPMLVLTCSAAICFAVRALYREEKARTSLALAGVALGLALLTKGLALLLVPVVAVFAAMVAWRWRSWPTRIWVFLLPLVIAFAVGGWWWLRNLLLLGRIQPSTLGDRERSAIAHEGYDLGDFIIGAIVRFNRTLWGRGARDDIALPTHIVDVAGLVLVGLVLVAVIVGSERRVLALLWTFPVLIVAVIFVNAHGIYWDLGSPDRGIQGRYVYAGIAAFCATFASLAVIVTKRLRAAIRRILASIFCAFAVVATASALGWVLERSWGADRAAALASIATSHGVALTLPISVMGVGLAASAALVTLFLLPWPVRTGPGRTTTRVTN